MNCKQGELAIYVGWVESLRGMVFLCAQPGKFNGCWIVSPRLPEGNYAYQFGEVMDSSLRPIRPQSDDATDETPIYAGAPRDEVLV